jgi:serine/threonine protein kinase
MVNRVGQQLGNYRLLRSLGRGGFAEVYLGEHLYLKRRAALKVLHTSLEDEEVGQFLSEAQTLARLDHPNIVRVLDFAVEQDGTPFLVMDYAPRGTLLQRHPRSSYLSLQTTVAYVKQVAAALQYAHNHHVIHRDVKPGNMLLGPQQQVMLSDFGLALFTSSPEQLSTQGREGTIPYMSPEQLRGKPTFASDQYALGIVVYEWLCGARPFEGDFWQLAYQHVSVPPPRLREKDPSLPEAVEAVVLRALAKDPADRYVSVQQFAQVFEKASAVAPLEVRSDSEVTARLGPISPATSNTATPKQVFLSASRADDALVARLTADLQKRWVTAWHEDPDSTQNSLNQEDAVRQAIRAVDVMLVLVSPNARSSRTIKEHLHIASLYQRGLIFVWVVGEDIADVLPQYWGKAAQVDLVDAREIRYEQALDEIIAHLEEDATPLAESVLPEPEFEPRNPYKGLHAFTKNDARDFFGRDRLVEELVNRVNSLLTPAQTGTPAARLLAVIGASGSGKSSVVMAGLLPRLERDALPGSQQWLYLEPMVPGTHPLEALALALAPRFPDRSVKSIREDLEDESARGLHLLATQLVKAPEQHVVLFVDQFEEVFTLTTSEEDRQQFIDLLLTTVTEPQGPVIILLTLRADFYHRSMSYPALHRLIEAHQTSALPIEVQDLRAIIKGPALLSDVQVIFEGNLVGDLLFEVQGQPGALPLLQFTLEQLFERRKDHLLTLQAYRELGGVKGALARHAEETYAALLSEEHRKLARALFLRLIDPGLTEQDTIRRRAALSELTLPDPTQTKILRETTDAFLAARLLTANEIAGPPTIEVSHEALIREWPRLAGWLREAHEDIRLQQTISKDAAEWERRNKPGDRLYRGSQLRETRRWAKRNIPSQREIAFLGASTAHRMRFIVSVIAVLLLLLSTAGVAGWLFLLLPPNPTLVTTLNDEGAGSLRWAIAAAKAGNTITFDARLRGTIVLASGDLSIAKSLVIRGPGASVIAISGRNSGHVVHVLRGSVTTISGLGFQQSNTGKTEIGFILNDGTLTLINSRVSGNTSSGLGGGILNNSIGKLALIDSAVSGNTANYGGGIYNLNGTLTLTNSTVSGNMAKKEGGGIYNFGKLTLTNSTVSGNTASGLGGGITFFGSQAIITFCTIYDNRAYEGGGIVLEQNKQHNKPSHVEIRNSIIAGNHAVTGPDIAGHLTSYGYNLIQNTAGATMSNAGSVTINLIGMAPGVGPLQYNGGPTQTYALLPGSPALDKIPTGVCHLDGISTDQRGVLRPQGPACDIGAYEFVPPH